MGREKRRRRETGSSTLPLLSKAIQVAPQGLWIANRGDEVPWGEAHPNSALSCVPSEAQPGLGGSLWDYSSYPLKGPLSLEAGVSETSIFLVGCFWFCQNDRQGWGPSCRGPPGSVGPLPGLEPRSYLILSGGGQPTCSPDPKPQE